MSVKRNLDELTTGDVEILPPMNKLIKLTDNDLPDDLSKFSDCRIDTKTNEGLFIVIRTTKVAPRTNLPNGCINLLLKDADGTITEATGFGAVGEQLLSIRSGQIIWLEQFEYKLSTGTHRGATEYSITISKDTMFTIHISMSHQSIDKITSTVSSFDEIDLDNRTMFVAVFHSGSERKEYASPTKSGNVQNLVFKTKDDRIVKLARFDKEELHLERNRAYLLDGYYVKQLTRHDDPNDVNITASELFLCEPTKIKLVNKEPNAISATLNTIEKDTVTAKLNGIALQNSSFDKAKLYTEVLFSDGTKVESGDFIKCILILKGDYPIERGTLISATVNIINVHGVVHLEADPDWIKTTALDNSNPLAIILNRKNKFIFFKM